MTPRNEPVVRNLPRWRLFIAAVVPDDAAQMVFDALARVRLRHPEARWIEPSAMHLTLLFLGSTDPAEVERISAGVTAVAADQRPIETRTGQAGGLPDGRRDGVAWLKLVGDDVPMLTRMARGLDDRLPGLRAGQIHAPHLTVARRVSEELLAELRAESRAEGIGVPIERIALYRSHTGRGPARYEELAATGLGAGRH